MFVMQKGSVIVIQQFLKEICIFGIDSMQVFYLLYLQILWVQSLLLHLYSWTVTSE